MTDFSILLADDESLARQYLRELLDEAQAGPILGEAESGPETLEMVLALRPEVLFLDVQMPGLTGLQVAALLQRRPHCPRIVFVTAFDEFAVTAFELEAADYLVKPVSPDRLQRALLRLGRPCAPLEQVLAAFERPRKLVVIEEKNGGRQLLEPRDVLWVASEGEYTYVQTEQGRWRCAQSLAALEGQWKELFRCHRAYLVNLERVEAIIPWAGGSYQLKVRGSRETIPLARRQAPAFKALIGWN